MRLQVLSPIRQFVEDTYERGEPRAANDAFQRLAAQMIVHAAVIERYHVPAGNAAHGMLRFGEEFANFSHIFDEMARRSESLPDYLEYLGALSSALNTFCFVSGHWARGIEMLNIGVAASRRRSHPARTLSLLLQLVSLARRTRDLALMRQTVHDMPLLVGGSTDPYSAGVLALAQGYLAEDEHQPADAERLFTQASDCFDHVLPATSGADAGTEIDTADRTSLEPDLRMLAMSLTGIGKSMEQSRPEQALATYRRALILMRRSNDGVNLGAVKHHIANCLATLDRHQEAFEEYVEAANEFFSIGASEHLSNALGELGYLLIHYEPVSSALDAFPPALIEAGMNDMLVEALQFLVATRILFRHSDRWRSSESCPTTTGS